MGGPRFGCGGGPTFWRPGENTTYFDNNSLFTQNTQHLPPHTPFRPNIASQHRVHTQPIPPNAHKSYGVPPGFSQMNRNCQSYKQQIYTSNTRMPSWYTLAYPQPLVAPLLPMNQHPLSKIFRHFFASKGFNELNGVKVRRPRNYSSYAANIILNGKKQQQPSTHHSLQQN